MTVDAKLFAWQRLQLELQDARQRLRRAMGDWAIDGAGLQRIDAEVRRLDRECQQMSREMD